MSFVDPHFDEENEACPESEPQSSPPKKVPKRVPRKSPDPHPKPPLNRLIGYLPPLDQIPDPETNQTRKHPTRRCAKCGERALAETVRKGRCIGCQVEAYLDTH